MGLARDPMSTSLLPSIKPLKLQPRASCCFFLHPFLCQTKKEDLKLPAKSLLEVTS